MNRIRLRNQQVQRASQAPQIAAELPLPAAPSQRRCHTTFVPLHYEPNYGYPLLVWLHGAGSNEQQLKSIVPGISARNYVAVAPRGTWNDQDRDDHAPLPSCGWFQSPEAITLSEHRVLECIRQTRTRFHVAAQRIFLLGSDCGGTMAMRIAMMHPELFAGVVSIGGRFPIGLTPLVRIKQARRVQILIQHARHGTGYREAVLCDDLRLMHVAGMSVTLRQYPGGDEITAQMLEDVNAWIMQQVTGARVPSGETTNHSSHEQN